MNERRKIEDRIRRKEAEIQELDQKSREARVYIQALNDVLKLIPRDVETSSAAESSASLRDGSSASAARSIILQAGKPVHLRELLKAMGKAPTRENRTSLASSLAAYVRKGEIFTRPRPAIFGLIELGHHEMPAQKVGPPAGFGSLKSDDDETSRS